MTQRNEVSAGRSAGIATLAIMLVLDGCAALARQDRAELLRDGFTRMPPGAYGEALPANTFTRRTINGVETVLYYDPAGCQCVYAGTEHDYQKYFEALEYERAESGGP